MIKYSGPELEDWPVLSGTYLVGNKKSPVAVLVISQSHEVTSLEKSLMEVAVMSGAAIAGICKTSNIGIERVIVNLVTNPNIRYLIVTGRDDNEFRVGKALVNVWLYGVDPMSGRVRCERDRVCTDDECPSCYISNLSKNVVERFRNQVTVIDAIAVRKSCAFQVQRVSIGSRSFDVPVKIDDDVYMIVSCVCHLPEIVSLLVHACLQERESRIRVCVAGKYIVSCHELYDPGAFPEPPPVIDMSRLGMERRVAEQQVSASSFSIQDMAVQSLRALPHVQDEYAVMYLMVPVLVPRQSAAQQVTAPALPVNSLVDLGWIVVGRFRRLRDGYEMVKKHILERGITRPTRHGTTREVCAVLIYEELPWFRFREENGRIIIEDFDFSDVEESTFPIKSREYFKQYCEDLLNGVWHDPGRVHYSYGAQLRRYGYDMVIFAEKLDLSEVAKSVVEKCLIVDQLRLIIENMVKMPLERCHTVVFWNPVLDVTGLRHQPCFVAIDFKIVPYSDSDWRLETTCLMRSHDFYGAHMENAYGLAAIINYIVWKLKQLDLERFAKLRVGRLIWNITSCHIYTTDVRT